MKLFLVLSIVLLSACSIIENRPRTPEETQIIYDNIRAIPQHDYMTGR